MKWLIGWLIVCAELVAAPFTVATYNLEFYVDKVTYDIAPKSLAAQKLIREGIKRMNPDVVAFQEVGSTNAFFELQASLKRDGLEFAHGAYMQGRDTNLHLAFLSKFPIVSRRFHTNETFLYQGRRFHVLRGFAEIEVAVGKERVTLITTHLKSKRQTVEADQQALREEEAVLLRERIDDFFKREPNGKLIVLGDLNDHISSKTLRTILGRGRTRLFDPRPAERNGDAMKNPNPQFEPRRIVWTHYFAKEETYGRYDYVLLSPNLRNAVDPQQTYVLAMPDWGVASDHRPVCVRLDF